MEVFREKDPLRANFHKSFPNPHMRTRKHVFLCKFREILPTESREIARCLMDTKINKISARALAAASARIAPKICHGQLQTMYSEFPKFHPNPFTSGGVIAERVNIVQTHHKVLAILGEASASSPSKDNCRPHVATVSCDLHLGSLRQCRKILSDGALVAGIALHKVIANSAITTDHRRKWPITSFCGLW